MCIKNVFRIIVELMVLFLVWMGVMFIDYMRVGASIEHNELIIVIALALSIWTKITIVICHSYREDKNIEKSFSP